MNNLSTDASSSRTHLSGESFTPVPVVPECTGEDLLPPAFGSEFRPRLLTPVARSMPEDLIVVTTQRVAGQTWAAAPLDNRSSTMVIGEGRSMQPEVPSQSSQRLDAAVLLRNMKDDDDFKKMEKIIQSAPGVDKVHAVINMLSGLLKKKLTDDLIYFFQQGIDVFSELKTEYCDSDERKKIFRLLDQLQMKISNEKKNPTDNERRILEGKGQKIQARRDEYIKQIRENLSRKKNEFSSIASNRASHSRLLTPVDRDMPREASTVKTQRVAGQTFAASPLDNNSPTMVIGEGRSMQPEVPSQSSQRLDAAVLLRNMKDAAAVKAMETKIEGIVGEENQARAAADILSSVVEMEEYHIDYLIHFLQKGTDLVSKLKKGFFNAEEEGKIVLLLTQLYDKISYQKHHPKKHERSILEKKGLTIQTQRNRYIDRLRTDLLSKKKEFSSVDSRRGITDSRKVIKNIFGKKLEPLYQALRSNMLDKETYNQFGNLIGIKQDFLNQEQQDNLVNSLEQQNSFWQNPEEETSFLYSEVPLDTPPLAFEAEQSYSSNKFEREQQNSLRQNSDLYSEMPLDAPLLPSGADQEYSSNFFGREQQNSLWQNSDLYSEVPLDAPLLPSEVEEAYPFNNFEWEQQNGEGNMGFPDFSTSLDTPLLPELSPNLVPTDAINSNAMQNVLKRSNSNSAMMVSLKKPKLRSWKYEFEKYKNERAKGTPDKKALFEAITATLFSLKSNESKVLDAFCQIHQEQSDFFQVLVKTFDAEDRTEEEKIKIYQTLVFLDNKARIQKNEKKKLLKNGPVKDYSEKNGPIKDYSESLLSELKDIKRHFAPSDCMKDKDFREKLAPILKECLEQCLIERNFGRCSDPEKVLILICDIKNRLDPQEVLTKLKGAGIDFKRDFYPRLRSEALGELYSSYEKLIKEKEEFLRLIKEKEEELLRQNSSLQNQEEALRFQGFPMSSGPLPVSEFFPDLDLE